MQSNSKNIKGMVVKMEQKELNNLSAEELDAIADALLAADDAKRGL